jgi:anti-sigma B factor antagonist
MSIGAAEGNGRVELNTSCDEGVTVLAVIGSVKLGESATQFGATLKRLLAETTGGVVVDFARLENLDSTGIGELVAAVQRFARAGRRLALLRPPQRLEALLKLTRLETIFPIFVDRQEALTYVGLQAGDR